MQFLPVALNITGKRILIIGGGKVALKKAKILLNYTDDITLLAKDFLEEIFSELKEVKFIKKEYQKNDLNGFSIVYICTNDEDLNMQIAEDAKKLGLLVNVCDRKEISDFISPAIYKKDNMSIAVSSNGEDVKKSVFIRDRIKELFENGNIWWKRL